MRNRNTQGFTLIELLIVIAIIGILAAVLIPNLLNARQRAFDTAAQTCLKEIVTAEEIYASIDPWVYYNDESATGVDVANIESCGNVYVETTGTDAGTDPQFTFGYSAAHINGSTVYQVSDGSGVTSTTDDHATFVAQTAGTTG